MSDVYKPSRLGQANNTGDTDALFLKVFSNEILATFEKTQIMKPLHTIRTISHGKSATFPTVGIAKSLYHTPGEDLLSSNASSLSKYGTDFNMNERVINIDKMLVSSTFIPNVEELQNHFDVRGQFSRELGTALAQRFDKAVLKTLAAGAEASGLSGQPGGIQITSATTTTGQGLMAALTEVARELDENDVPDDGTRFAILTPTQYYKLITDASLNIALNKDYGGSGSVATGDVPQVLGINIFKSNNLVSILADNIGSADVEVNDDENANNNPYGAVSSSQDGYNKDISGVKFLAGHPSGVGTVKLLDLSTESDYQVRNQGTLFVAKYAMGHNYLRPAACVTVA